jgi:hypothetical protein
VTSCLNYAKVFRVNTVVLFSYIAKNKDSFSGFDLVFNMSKLLRHSVFPSF